MKRVLAMLAAAWLAGCSDGGGGDNGGGSDVNVTRDNNGATVSAAVGDTVIVRLAGNPTTGYQWTVKETDSTRLPLEASTYAADSKLVGSGGMYEFRFAARAAGDAALRLVYQRAWEPAPLETFSVTVRIY